EIVARAIAAALVPIVSAVGHEIDFTIADFVADLRAPTPSAAAELIVPAATELDRRVNELVVCLQRYWRNFIVREQTRLRLFSEFARRLAACPPQLVSTMRKRFERAEKIHAVVGPDATLRRGYSMTLDATGNLVRSVTQVKRGDRLRTRVTDGTIESDVAGI